MVDVARLCYPAKTVVQEEQDPCKKTALLRLFFLHVQDLAWILQVQDSLARKEQDLRNETDIFRNIRARFLDVLRA